MSDEFRFDENDNGGHIKNTNVHPINKYPPDYGLRQQVRAISDTQSVFEVFLPKKDSEVVFMPQMQVVDEYISRIDPVARGYSQVKSQLDENTATEVTKKLTPVSNVVSYITSAIPVELPMPPYNYQKEDYTGGSITGPSVYMNPLGDRSTPIKMPQVDLSDIIVANTGLSWYERTSKFVLEDLNKRTTLSIDPTNCDVVFTGNKYKYNELNLLNEMVKYVDKTYSEHYSSGRGKTQALDSIIDSGHGFSFCIGNVLKYAQRLEKKGTREDGRKDLQKIIHYALLALNEYDQETLQMNEAK